MNSDILKGKWNQIKGDIKSKWGKLTNEELDKIEGDQLKLQGLIQEKYGIKKEEAEKKIQEIVDKYSNKA